MSFDLHVSILRNIRVEEEFESTRSVLTDLMQLGVAPQLAWEYPLRPKVRSGLQDDLTDGTSFYVTLSDVGAESLVQFGVADTKKYGVDEPLFASFSAHDGAAPSVLALAMAIALARLVGARVEDGSGHWFTTATSDPAELIERFRIEVAPKDLRTAIGELDKKLDRGRICGTSGIRTV